MRPESSRAIDGEERMRVVKVTVHYQYARVAPAAARFRPLSSQTWISAVTGPDSDRMMAGIQPRFGQNSKESWPSTVIRPESNCDPIGLVVWPDRDRITAGLRLESTVIAAASAASTGGRNSAGFRLKSSQNPTAVRPDSESVRMAVGIGHYCGRKCRGHWRPHFD